MGHEFHRWQLNTSIKKKSQKAKHDYEFEEHSKKTWMVSGWKIERVEEGWSNDLFHASWVHLHWPSSPIILHRWQNALKRNIQIQTR